MWPKITNIMIHRTGGSMAETIKSNTKTSGTQQLVLCY